ncbi:anti-sigma factor family protein [Occultella gossypii]|uniref:Zf-HC2 domain-containing protein n=1 Tax=Occultella gossypii TaxID=2800820 RepID=A0ABS7SAZ0_9MICO|nr:zf-HC2 domain-containing protein [Occultella gossypii]MBZ2197507.1 zf-HC2 domain-containing protein [Occultella gossypii]
MSTDRYADWDGAYVLGSLSPTERREYEEHLAGCPACRAAVTDLAGMPGLLAQVSAEDARTLLAGMPGPPSEASPDAARTRLADEPAPVTPLRPRTRPPLRRRLLAVAAAIALVLLGGVGGLALAQRDTAPPTDAIELELTQVDASGVSADVQLTPRPWGTSLGWDCSYPTGQYAPPEDAVYTLTLVDADGARTVAATWTSAGGGASGLSAATDLPTEAIVAVEIGLAGQEDALASGTL